MRARGLLAGASVLATLAGTPIHAQVRSAQATAATDLGEVVVTARKREERLRDVPVSASVVNLEDLLARGDVSDPQTVLNSVPGVKFLDTSSPGNSEITMRGSGQGRGTSTEAAVGLYRNDVYVGGGVVGGRTFSRLDLLDVEQFQVLRGPQGALYGRNAVGGAVIIASARPKWKASGFANLNYQFESHLKQIQSAINIPLSDEVAVRLSGEYLDQPKGFFYNASQDNYIDSQKGYAFRGQLRFKRGGFDANILAEDGLYDLPALRATFDIPRGSSGFPLGYTTPKYVSYNNTVLPTKQHLQTVIAKFEWVAGFGTLNSVSAYRHRVTRTTNDTDQFDAATLAREQARGNATTVTDANATTNNNDDFESFFHDTHVSGAQGGIQWLAGIEILDTDDKFTTLTYRTPTRTNPSIGNYLPGRGRYTSISPYGSIGYTLSERLSTEAEVRYSSDQRRRTNAGFTLPTNAPIAAQTSSDRDRYSNLDYAFSLSYRPLSAWTTYVRLATGYRAGGFNANQGDLRAPKPVTPTFDPERGTSLEAGLKGDIAPGLFVTGAAYRTRVRDFQAQVDNGCAVTNPVCPVASVAFISNLGAARVWGLEATANGRWRIAGGRLSLNASLSRQSGELKLTGHPIPQNPRWVRAADFNYRHDIADNVSGFVNLSYSGQSGGLQEIDSALALDDRDILDGRIGVTFGDIELAAYGNNLGDESYYVFASATQKRWSTPRNYGVQLRVKW